MAGSSCADGRAITIVSSPKRRLEAWISKLGRQKGAAKSQRRKRWGVDISIVAIGRTRTFEDRSAVSRSGSLHAFAERSVSDHRAITG